MPPKQVAGLSHGAVANSPRSTPPWLGWTGQGQLVPSASNPSFTTAGPWPQLITVSLHHELWAATLSTLKWEQQYLQCPLETWCAEHGKTCGQLGDSQLEASWGCLGGKAGKAFRGPTLPLGMYSFIHSSAQGFWSPRKAAVTVWVSEKAEQDPVRALEGAAGGGEMAEYMGNDSTLPPVHKCRKRGRKSTSLWGGQGRLPGESDI